MSMTVNEIMTQEVITLPPGASLFEARNLMNQHRIRHLPVCDAGRLLTGLLSHRDILAALPAPSPDETTAHYEARLQQLTVSDIMTPKVVTISPKTGIKQAAMTIERHKFGCLPVVNSERQLVGLVTSSDFVAIAINLLETMESGEPDL